MQCRVAATATDVEHALARSGRDGFDGREAERRELQIHALLPERPGSSARFVPETPLQLVVRCDVAHLTTVGSSWVIAERYEPGDTTVRESGRDGEHASVAQGFFSSWPPNCLRIADSILFV